MTEIILKTGLEQSVRHPETYSEVGIHPQTKKRGRFGVRRGKPVQVWDKKAHRMRWVQPVEVEELPERDDGSTVFVICDGGMSDFKDISKELASYRQKRRRNNPTLAPRAAYIQEACKEMRIRGQDSYRVGNQVFTRPSKGLLIPRNAAWAKAMAEESRRL